MELNWQVTDLPHIQCVHFAIYNNIIPHNVTQLQIKSPIVEQRYFANGSITKS